ncbi:hypothetical protein AJ88_43630 [Mesorhizobium amorphae CCBAU 01583]|nr:hypothetical protein AJ88_43630 [Mesorhizobium amorphae CCBAU 01583]
MNGNSDSREPGSERLYRLWQYAPYGRFYGDNRNLPEAKRPNIVDFLEEPLFIEQCTRCIFKQKPTLLGW